MIHTTVEALGGAQAAPSELISRPANFTST